MASPSRPPPTRQTVDFHTGTGSVAATYTGVLPWDLLSAAGISSDPSVKNDILRRVVVVVGSDGSVAMPSLGEPAPQFGGEQVMVAYAADGVPLGSASGFAELAAPGDEAGGRDVDGCAGKPTRSSACRPPEPGRQDLHDPSTFDRVAKDAVSRTDLSDDRWKIMILRGGTFQEADQRPRDETMTHVRSLKSVHISSTPDPTPQDGGTIVSHKPGDIIDLDGISDTTVLAYGHRDTVNLYTQPDDAEGSGNTIHLLGDKSVVNTGEGGANAIFLSGRNDTVAGQGFPGSNGDTIHAAGGGAVIGVGGNNTVLLSGTDARVTILETRPGDSDTPLNDSAVIASGSGKATVTGAGAEFSFAGGGGTYVVDGGTAESSTISGGAGGGIFTGGTYMSPFPEGPGGYFYVGDDTITAGARRSTLVGGSHGSSVLFATGSAHDVLIAGQYGSDTLSGGTSTVGNLFEGYRGAYVPTDDTNVPSLVIRAGGGNDTLVAGNAAETLTGGGGHDLFRFIDQPSSTVLPTGGGHTLITDFMPGTDKIDLRGFTETAQQVVASETVRGGSTTIALSDHAVVTLAHVTHLSVKDFTFSGS